MYWKAAVDPCHLHLGKGAANTGQVLGYKDTDFLEELIRFLVISLPNN